MRRTKNLSGVIILEQRWSTKVRQGSVTRWKFRSDRVKMAHGGKFTRLKREYARERTPDMLKIMRYVLLIRVSLFACGSP